MGYVSNVDSGIQQKAEGRARPPRRKVVDASTDSRGWRVRLECGHQALVCMRRCIDPPKPKSTLCYACFRGEKPAQVLLK